MSNPQLYRRFNLLRLSGILSPKPVGGFVVGVPTKDVRTFQTENPTVAIDGVLKLVSAEKFDEVRRRLQIPLGTDLGLYSRSIGLFKRRSHRNSPNVTVLDVPPFAPRVVR